MCHATELHHSQAAHLFFPCTCWELLSHTLGQQDKWLLAAGLLFFNKTGAKTLCQGFDHIGLIYISSITSQIFEFQLKAVSELKTSISYDKAEDAILQS